MANELKPTAFQHALLRWRGHLNILSAGGRGSGKSMGMIFALMSHCHEFGAEATPLVLRESWQALVELQTKVYEICRGVFGDAIRNKAEGTIVIPATGSMISFSNITDDESYAKLQGRTFSGMFADEVGNYPPQAFEFMNRVRSNLRVRGGHRRPEIHWTANPHGRSHSLLYKRYVSRARPWTPFKDDFGDMWMWTRSTLEDNEHINRDAYVTQLRASTGGDDALAKAWIEGEWSVLGGSMFAPPFDPAVHIVSRPPTCRYGYRLGGDWGASAPAVALLLGEVGADVHGYAPGSIIVLDEIDTADPTDLSRGNGAPPQVFADMIREMCASHGWTRPSGAMDDARGLQSETVIQLMQQDGIHFWKPYKRDRIGGWNLIRQLLTNAVEGDGPGLYIANRCAHLLETLPEAPRGPLRPEDMDPKWQRDHWCDALSYGVRDIRMNRVSYGTTTGLY